MESKVLQDKYEDQKQNQATESTPTVSREDTLKLASSFWDYQGDIVERGKCTEIAFTRDVEGSGEVNMEASITTDDVVRAGGLGARDDISSFLPVAADSTDFEASIRDARGYEEPQAEIRRRGLGWKEDSANK